MDKSAGVLLVNKQTAALARDYVPEDLTETRIAFLPDTLPGRRRLRLCAARALEKLVAAARDDGVTLLGVSGFRSYEEQESIYEKRVSEMGREYADAYIARPGKSEHQTGLAMDMAGISGEPLDKSFADAVEGRWLAGHCAEFGFIIRYPKGKEAVTGYSWEPWHIRYVGEAVAREILRHGITLDDYSGRYS